MTSFTLLAPNVFCRSACFPTSPFETFTKTLLIWRTSSRFVSLLSLEYMYSRADGDNGAKDVHAIPPFLHLILVARDLVHSSMSKLQALDAAGIAHLESFATFLQTHDRDVC